MKKLTKNKNKYFLYREKIDILGSNFYPQFHFTIAHAVTQ